MASENEQELMKLTVAQLKEILKLNNIPISGNKKVLIDRIIEHRLFNNTGKIYDSMLAMPSNSSPIIDKMYALKQQTQVFKHQIQLLIDNNETTVTLGHFRTRTTHITPQPKLKDFEVFADVFMLNTSVKKLNIIMDMNVKVATTIKKILQSNRIVSLSITKMTYRDQWDMSWLKEINDGLVGSTTLKHLYLSNCDLKSDFVTWMPILDTITTLKTFVLSGNEFGDAHQLVPMLNHLLNNGLESLDLNSCMIYNIMDALSNCTSLKYVDLTSIAHETYESPKW